MSYRQEVVSEAAKWLDGIKPGWPMMVDFDNLKMQDGNWCVAGQVFAKEAMQKSAEMAEETVERDELSYWCDGYDYIINSVVRNHGVINVLAFSADDLLVEFWEAEVKARLNEGISV